MVSASTKIIIIRMFVIHINRMIDDLLNRDPFDADRELVVILEDAAVPPA
jgi:hypothetical protein